MLRSVAPGCTHIEMRVAAFPLCSSYRYLFFGTGEKSEISVLPTSLLKLEQLYHKPGNVST